MNPRVPRLALLLVLVALAAGCTQTTTLIRTDGARPVLAGARVLLMPTTITLYELTAGGLQEPKADWTASARTHILTALQGELAKDHIRLVAYWPPNTDPSKQYAYIQIDKLHDLVGVTILKHRLGLGPSLPTKQDVFDWSLGAGARVLHQDTGADYGLFLFIQDSYATAGRKAMMAVAAVGGVVVPGGRQLGFASLVDLTSGDIVWFNWLPNGTHDLRAADTARKAIRELLAGFPR